MQIPKWIILRIPITRVKFKTATVIGILVTPAATIAKVMERKPMTAK